MPPPTDSSARDRRTSQRVKNADLAVVDEGEEAQLVDEIDELEAIEGVAISTDSP